MREHFDIAGYCRISVDEEAGRDNVSIENQKAIIQDYVRRTFPDSTLTFYEDRDRSGYTFEQREGYQVLRRKMLQWLHTARFPQVLTCQSLLNLFLLPTRLQSVDLQIWQHP